MLDLLGTFVFALSGAAAGVKSKLDLFGLMVLAFAAGNAGGITRDLLIGSVPPAAISDWRYLGVSLLAGLVTFSGIPISTCGAGPCCCSMARAWPCSPSPDGKSAGCRTQSGDGGTYGNVDRDWRRYVTRSSRQPDSYSAPV